MAKKYRLYFLLVISLLLFACTAIKPVIKHPQKVLQLNRELQRWKTFQMEGIIEVSYKMFVFRKNFIISKNEDALRADLLDTGIFGLSASSISVYADSSLNIKGYIGKKSLEISVNEESKKLYSWLNHSEADSLKNQYDNIMNNNMLEIQGWTLKTNSAMRLVSVIHEKNKIKAELFYNFKDELEKIIFTENGSEICNIRIDKISYNNITVQKLKR